MFNAGLDLYDERNYPYSEVAWTNKVTPDFVVNDDGIIQDQYKDWYNMWCVYYSVSMHDNFLNLKDWVEERSKGSELCDESETWSPTQWDYLINWPKLIKRKGLIKWYAQVKSLEDAYTALADGNQISTWSNKINWRLTRTWDYYAQGNSWAWHAFTIIGYNRTNEYKEKEGRRIPPMCFIVKDSSNWFNAWYFYIKIEEFNSILYNTKLTFINNTDLIDNYKKRVMEQIKLDSAKLFFLLWLTNWERPQENITREEVMAMNYRVIEKIVSWEITKDSLEKAKEELKRLS
jgi:hypothetical protein